MNKRINILAEQAGLHCDGTPDCWDQEAIARFAELIVRECGEISRHHTLSRSGHKGKEEEFTGTVDLQEEILKHFGIKESKND